ncbi:hydroquinone glucosyltransferase-like [Mangifera indica]|uniref:hydroquinone glucosyltransferase-like n=1 Tax=Mangifera indica TaxID=29780 RepID=UPI001CFA9E10|nr:hydroquinone glucosyltransferase-like [Mangifera indica]XP_044501387.1 hydroquinone glucosyltransferase-like [Mangifera indica]
MEKTQTKMPHIAIVPTPGMGHLIPLIEFAKRLFHQHQFAVTFIIPNNGPPTEAQKSTLASLPASINSIFLPPVTFDDNPEGTKIETIISLTLVRSLPSLRDALKPLVANTSLVSLVVDLFGTDAFDVAKEFNLSPFIFFPSTAMTLSLFLYLPTLDALVTCEYRDLPEPVKIPGCIPIHGKYLLDPAQDRKNEAYKWLLHHSKRFKMAEGIMVNSFMGLEGEAIKALQEAEPGKPPVYPVGPLVKMGSSSSIENDESLKWLDNQPRGSVLFVSFGSGGTLSSAQLKELALGLEMSEQRFLWVVRSPNDEVANATFFGIHSQNEFLKFLPEGFLERTKGRGLVVPSWAPQAQVLSHGSTGGFLSHCGWNSVLESVVNGVPLIAWPLYAEQKMNAVSLTEDIKVALRPKASEKGLIEKQEIARVVKGLMEGEEGKSVRYRMKDLKEAATVVLSENGSSTKALAEVALKWKNKIPN